MELWVKPAALPNKPVKIKRNLNMENAIAFFDFDGTITSRDSLLELIKYSHGVRGFYAGFALLSPWLIGMKSGIVSNSDAKQRVLAYYYGGWALERWQALCSGFVSERVPELLRPKAMEEIRRCKAAGIQAVVVSASPEDMVGIWAREQGLGIIGTRLEVREGRMTGKIAGNNCHGEEKVRRIREQYEIASFGTVYAYGDSGGDKAMLGMAGRAFYKPFR
jgi:HAD superfamily hydrolase (TIGR01490 family)